VDLVQDRELEIGDECVAALEQREIGLDALAHGEIGEVLEPSFAIRGVGDALPERIEVVGVDRVLNVHEELSALAREVEPAAQQVPGCTHRDGADVGPREHAAVDCLSRVRGRGRGGCSLSRRDRVNADLAGGVEDADVHRARLKIDAAVVLMLTGVSMSASSTQR
jgi:hypothetical protein